MQDSQLNLRQEEHHFEESIVRKDHLIREENQTENQALTGA